MGAISNTITFYFKFQNTERETISATRTYTFARSSKLQQWNHICLDMHKLVSEDSWVKSRMSSSPNFKLNYIKVHRDGSGNEDALVDDVWIGKSFISGRLFIFSRLTHLSYQMSLLDLQDLPWLQNIE